LLSLAVVLLIAVFSKETGDFDFWWTLKTGQYIVETRSLPLPDPFTYTTQGAHDAYAGESITRHFNLTSEWLAQAILFSVYRAGGFAGTVWFRALLLTCFCGIAGWIAYRRSRGFYLALAAVFATAAVVSGGFVVDRSFLFTYVLLAATLAILESRRWLWVLPAVCLLWANCHGGFFLSWVLMGAYSAEALVLRLRGKSLADDRLLWGICAVSFLASGLNPNGFRIVQVLIYYRNSFLQSKLLEWSPSPLWPPSIFSVLLIGAAAVLLWARRRVRIADWLLLVAFGAASLMAYRNVVLVGFLAPILIVSYLPEWKRPMPAAAQWATAALIAGALIFGLTRGSFFQLRAAEWRYPRGAADFLLAHHVTGPIFNTYEYGGYLMWRLWPEQRVFIDGRALSESVFQDYARILYHRDVSDGGQDGMELLDRYGVQAIVMNGFEYFNGLSYDLAPALASPQQKDWKLVYNDPQVLIFMRHVPDGVAPLDSHEVFDHLEAECSLHIEHEPKYTRCARKLGQIFTQAGELKRARRWIGLYLSYPHEPDPEADDAYLRLVRSGN
jgi:hypothetical protein